jgi:hypothetical protein
MLAPTVITASNPLDGGLRDLQANDESEIHAVAWLEVTPIWPH